MIVRVVKQGNFHHYNAIFHNSQGIQVISHQRFTCMSDSDEDLEVKPYKFQFEDRDVIKRQLYQEDYRLLKNGKRIHVDNLSPDVTDAELKKHMSYAGRIYRLRILCDLTTGKSLGKGVVEYSSNSEAENAIKMLNKSMLMGRRLQVTLGILTSKNTVSANDYFISTNYTNADPLVLDSSRQRLWQVLISGLPIEASESDVLKYVRNITITDLNSCKILYDKDGHPIGKAVLYFADLSQASSAVSLLNNTVFAGKTIVAAIDEKFNCKPIRRIKTPDNFIPDTTSDNAYR